MTNTPYAPYTVHRFDVGLGYPFEIGFFVALDDRYEIFVESTDPKEQNDSSDRAYAMHRMRDGDAGWQFSEGERESLSDTFGAETADRIVAHLNEHGIPGRPDLNKTGCSLAHRTSPSGGYSPRIRYVFDIGVKNTREPWEVLSHDEGLGIRYATLVALEDPDARAVILEQKSGEPWAMTPKASLILTDLYGGILGREVGQRLCDHLEGHGFPGTDDGLLASSARVNRPTAIESLLTVIDGVQEARESGGDPLAVLDGSLDAIGLIREAFVGSRDDDAIRAARNEAMSAMYEALRSAGVQPITLPEVETLVARVQKGHTHPTARLPRAALAFLGERLADLADDTGDPREFPIVEDTGPLDTGGEA